MAKWHDKVRTAYAKGYRVTDDGRVISPKGRELVLVRHQNCNYPRFSFWDCTTQKRQVTYVHFLAAYCFHGEEAFKGLVIRHLDDDPLNVRRDNILLGTQYDNEADKKANREKWRKHWGFDDIDEEEAA